MGEGYRLLVENPKFCLFLLFFSLNLKLLQHGALHPPGCRHRESPQQEATGGDSQEGGARMRFALSLCAAVLLPTAASSFNLAPRPPQAVGCHPARSWERFRERAAQAHVRAQAPESDSDVEPSRPSALERAWQRFVLLLS